MALPNLRTVDRWSLLAGLRFLLASIVAFNHLGREIDIGFFAVIPKFGAFEAILGFLLVSGYSITWSYLNEPRHFLARRALRIFPTYWASMVLTLAVSIYALHEAWPSVATLAVNALMLNQLLTSVTYVETAWSLSVEVWLYALAPLLVLARPALCRWLIYISFGSYLVYTVCRTLLHAPYYSGVGYGLNLLFLSFAWICGLRLAREPEARASIMRDLGVIFVLHLGEAVGIQLLYRLKHHEASLFLGDAFGYLCQTATLALVYYLFACHVFDDQTGRRKSIVLRFLGDVSYPFYLVHIPIYTLLLKLTPLRSWPLIYLIALASSAVLYWVVDRYSRRRHLQLAAG